MRAFTLKTILFLNKYVHQLTPYIVLLPIGVEAWQNESKAPTTQHQAPVACLLSPHHHVFKSEIYGN